MDILDDIGLSKLSANVFFKSELFLYCMARRIVWVAKDFPSIEDGELQK